MRPLIDGDPRQVTGYRIVGRLGEGGQGVVYLGESPDRTRVAVKMLGAGLDDPGARERFRQEIGYARRVKEFCTAQVLASGELGGMPYVVSEYVDGPSLAEVIRERGTLREAELRRLAIGTLTALAAIHQAGVVHRDFKPGNVLLSRDGPRVIDFGISTALEEAELAGEYLVGTPPYMAPEQFGGLPAGPPADLFAWAATMVAAASGGPPFGTGELPALINRILHAEPDLGGLDGEVRDLAMRCLAKDPGARPTATQALLSLLGQRVPERHLLAEGQQSAAPPARAGGPLAPGNGWPAGSGPLAGAGSFSGGRGSPAGSGALAGGTGPLAGSGEPARRDSFLRRGWPIVAGVTGAVVAVTVALLLLLRPAPAPGPPAPTAPPLPTPRQGPMALTSVSELKIPDTGITVHENPADPIWVSSYHDHRKQGTYASYARNAATGAFGFFGNWEEPIVSPGGGYVASLSITRFRKAGFENIRLREVATGRERELRTVDKPATLTQPRWSADGRRLLATVMAAAESDRAVGFALVDVVAGAVKIIKVAEADAARYAWGSDGASVLHQAADGAVRVLDLAGKPVRVHAGVGKLVSGEVVRTTLGTVFTTICRDISRNICLWDEMSGDRKGVVSLPKGAAFRGWLDERHFLATKPAAQRTDVVLMDLNGQVVRTLADGPAAEVDQVVLWFTRK
ncbi:protein kinase domain-containing protein [Nonomuraea sp. NPDC002799]